MKNYKRYSLRVSEEILDKIGYIAKQEGRTKNKQIEFLLRKHIESFERMHGYIDLNINKKDD